MNNKNERQHYVSRVLLERFRLPRSPLQCYQVKSGKWRSRSVERVCSARGYNQFLLPNELDNAIEDSFSKVESQLPITFAALEDAASCSSTTLPKHIYENLCLYCTFLKQTSLFAKPAAISSFLFQINMEIEKGEYCLLRELNVSDEVIANFRSGYFNGGRIIVEAENILQLMHRFQFERLFKVNYWEFLNCSWIVSHSPFELPMSDIGLVLIQLKDINAKQYLLPIGPKFLLEGIFYFDFSKNSSEPVICGHTLTTEEAEYRLDTICASAVEEVVCSRQYQDVMMCIERAKAKGVTFNRIVNPQLAKLAGLDIASNKYSLRMVSKEEYVRFIHSFIQPPGLTIE